MNCIKQGLTHCSLLYLKLNRLQNHLHFKTGIYSKYSDKLQNTCFLAFANNLCAFFLDGSPDLSHHQVNDACVMEERHPWGRRVWRGKWKDAKGKWCCDLSER